MPFPFLESRSSSALLWERIFKIAPDVMWLNNSCAARCGIGEQCSPFLLQTAFCHPAAYRVSSCSSERGFSCRLLISGCSNRIYKTVTWDSVGAHVPSFWKDRQPLTAAGNLCFPLCGAASRRTAAGSGAPAWDSSAISRRGCKAAKFSQRAWTAFVDVSAALRTLSAEAACVFPLPAACAGSSGEGSAAPGFGGCRVVVAVASPRLRASIHQRTDDNVKL